MANHGQVIRPINRGQVPPGGYCRYKDPDTGFEIAHPYYDHVKGLARQHRVEKGFLIPHDWDEWFDIEYCKSTPTACQNFPDGNAEKAPSFLQLATNFTRSMMHWAMSGFKVVDYDQFKERYSQCAGRPSEGDSPGLPQCKYFGRFPAFGLTKCSYCGCAGLKLYIKTEKCPIGKW